MSLQVMQIHTGTRHVFAEPMGDTAICGTEWESLSLTTERVTCKRCVQLVEYVARRLPLDCIDEPRPV